MTEQTPHERQTLSGTFTCEVSMTIDRDGYAVWEGAECERNREEWSYTFIGPDRETMIAVFDFVTETSPAYRSAVALLEVRHGAVDAEALKQVIRERFLRNVSHLSGERIEWSFSGTWPDFMTRNSGYSLSEEFEGSLRREN